MAEHHFQYVSAAQQRGYGCPRGKDLGHALVNPEPMSEPDEKLARSQKVWIATFTLEATAFVNDRLSRLDRQGSYLNRVVGRGTGLERVRLGHPMTRISKHRIE